MLYSYAIVLKLFGSLRNICPCLSSCNRHSKESERKISSFVVCAYTCRNEEVSLDLGHLTFDGNRSGFIGEGVSCAFFYHVSMVTGGVAEGRGWSYKIR